MHTVIRVQDTYGRGMFYRTEIEDVEDNTSVYHIPKLTSLCNRHTEFPNMTDDNGLYMGVEGNVSYQENSKNWRYSFQNLNQFEAWVTRDEVAILDKYGYRVFKIVAKEVVVGDFQNLFHIDSVVSSEDITEIFL